MNRGGLRTLPCVIGGLQTLVALAFFFAAGFASAEGCASWGSRLCERIDSGAVVETEWALGTPNGRSQKLDIEVEPRLEVDLGKGLSLESIVRFRVDAFDRLEPGRPKQRSRSVLS